MDGGHESGIAGEDLLLLHFLKEEVRPVLSKKQYGDLMGELAETVRSLAAQREKLTRKREAVPEATHQFEELSAGLSALERKQRMLEEAARRSEKRRQQLRARELAAALERERDVKTYLADTEELFRELKEELLEGAKERTGLAAIEERRAALAACQDELLRSLSRAESLLGEAASEQRREPDRVDNPGVREPSGGAFPGTPDEPRGILDGMREMLKEGAVRLEGVRSLLYLIGIAGNDDCGGPEPAFISTGTGRDASQDKAFMEGRRPEELKELIACLNEIRAKALSETIREEAENLIRHMEEQAASYGLKLPTENDGSDHSVHIGSLFFEAEAEDKGEGPGGSSPPQEMSIAFFEADSIPPLSSEEEVTDVSSGGLVPEGVALLLKVTDPEHEEAGRMLAGMPESVDYTEAADAFGILRPLVLREALNSAGERSKALARYTEELLEEVKGMEQRSYLNENVRRKQFARRAAKAYKTYRELLTADPSGDASEEEASSGPGNLAHSFLELMLHLMVLPEVPGFSGEEIKEQVAEWTG